MSTPLADQLREYFDALQNQVTHLKDAADQAREETSAQVRARIEQAKADVAADQEPARGKAGLPGVDGLPVGVLNMPASRHVIHPSRYPELETNGRFLSGRLAVTRG